MPNLLLVQATCSRWSRQCLDTVRCCYRQPAAPQHTASPPSFAPVFRLQLLVQATCSRWLVQALARTLSVVSADCLSPHSTTQYATNPLHQCHTCAMYPRSWAGVNDFGPSGAGGLPCLAGSSSEASVGVSTGGNNSGEDRARIGGFRCKHGWWPVPWWAACRAWRATVQRQAQRQNRGQQFRGRYRVSTGSNT